MPWNELNHQPDVVHQLRQSLKLNRLAHAYLFTGEEGSGKRTLAKALASTLNCLENQQDYCGQCDACRRIAEDNHPDIHRLRPESKSRRILTEQVRELERPIYQKPSLGRTKVAIIEDAECLQINAANAFLKTLEEPPAATFFILTSSQPERLLDTILSRCRRLQFRTIEPEGRTETEQNILGMLATPKNKVGTVIDAYQRLALIMVLNEEQAKKIEEEVRSNFDVEQYGENVDKGFLDRVEDQIEARIESTKRRWMRQVTSIFYRWYRDLLLLSQSIPSSRLEFPEYREALEIQARGMKSDNIQRCLQTLEHLDNLLSTNVSPLLAWEIALLKIQSAQN